MKIKIVVLILLAILFAIGILSPTNPPAGGPGDSADKLRVLATFFPVADFAAQVGGEHVAVSTLFFQSPEVASFTVRDVQKVRDAQVIVKNGAGLEVILDELIRASDSHAAIIDTSAGVSFIAEPEEEHQQTEPGDHPEEEEEDHHHEGANPHIWLDPNNAIIQVENIRRGLSEADPDHADYYQERADEYTKELRSLHEEIRRETATFSKQEFIAFHPAFFYLARAYGLTQAASIETSPGREPSPAEIAVIISLIRRRGITSLFAEPQFSPKIVAVIAQDLGLTVRILDPLETGELGRESYISKMKKNLTVLKEALQ